MEILDNARNRCSFYPSSSIQYVLPSFLKRPSALVTSAHHLPRPAPQLSSYFCPWQDMERSSKRLPSRHPQDEGDDECHEDSKKPAKKSRSRCSVHDYKTNISGCVIDESPTLPLDAFVVVMEFLHPRVRDYFPFLYSHSMENWATSHFSTYSMEIIINQ